MTTDTLDKATLGQFTGTENWYRHGLVRGILFTDGAKYVADTAGAYWLLDEIALAQQFEPIVKREEFQVWKLIVLADNKARLQAEDGDGGSIFSKLINFTDFPAPGIELWFENRTIYLPSER